MLSKVLPFMINPIDTQIKIPTVLPSILTDTKVQTYISVGIWSGQFLRSERDILNPGFLSGFPSLQLSVCLFFIYFYFASLVNSMSSCRHIFVMCCLPRVLSKSAPNKRPISIACHASSSLCSFFDVLKSRQTRQSNYPSASYSIPSTVSKIPFPPPHTTETSCRAIFLNIRKLNRHVL